MITRRGLMIGAVLGAGAFAGGFAVSRWRREEPRMAGAGSGDSAWGTRGGQVIESSSAEPSDKAVDFSFTDQHGRAHRFSDWDGRVRVVNFWATWCPPCVHEIPMLVSVQEAFRAHDVRFVGVAVDDPEQAFAMANELGMNYPTMADSRQSLDLLRTYGNRATALPFTAFVDSGGAIRDRHVGELTLEQTEEKIRALLP